MLQNFLLEGDRTKQSAHSNILIGKVVSVRNPVRDGKYLEPLWNVQFTNRRRNNAIAHDLRSAVPLRVGHEVFFTLQDGDLLRGGFILGQTTEPRQWTADSGLITRYNTGVWNTTTNVSTLAVGTIAGRDLSESEETLVDAQPRVTNPKFISTIPDITAFLDAEPSDTYLQTSFLYVVPQERMIFDLLMSHTFNLVYSFNVDSRNFTEGAVGFAAGSGNVYTWKVSMSYNLAGESPVFMDTLTSRRFTQETLAVSPFGSSVSQFAYNPLDVVTDVLHPVPLPVSLTEMPVMESPVGMSTHELRSWNNRNYEFPTNFVLEGRGLVGRLVQLNVYAELYTHELSEPPTIVESTHRVDNLRFVLSEIGVGSNR